jgi:hypothetical protein
MLGQGNLEGGTLCPFLCLKEFSIENESIELEMIASELLFFE